MYPKTKFEQKIIVERKILKLNRVILRGFAISIFCWFSIGIDNYGLAQTEDASPEEKIDPIRLVSQKIQELVKSQPVSTFVLDELKQRMREKHKQEMKQFNYKRNQKLSAIFERFQKIRYQPVIYSGKHYDYTSYNQYFQAAQSR